MIIGNVELIIPEFFDVIPEKALDVLQLLFRWFLDLENRVIEHFKNASYW